MATESSSRKTRMVYPDFGEERKPHVSSITHVQGCSYHATRGEDGSVALTPTTEPGNATPPVSRSR